MSQEINEKEKKPKLPPPIIDSVNAVLNTAKKCAGRTGASLTSREKHELHLSRLFYMDNYSQFNLEQTQYLLDNFPNKNLNIISMPPPQLEALIEKCLKDKKPFLIALDFSSFKKEKIQELLPKYIKLLNEVGDEKNLSYYFSRYSPTVSDIFLNLGKKQSKAFCRAATAHRPALIFKCEGFTSEEKIEWIDENKAAILNIFNKELSLTFHRFNGIGKIDDNAVLRGLEICSEAFIDEMRAAGQSKNKNETEAILSAQEKTVFSKYEPIFNTQSQIIDFLAQKDEAFTLEFFKRQAPYAAGDEVLNIGQEIFKKMINNYQHGRLDEVRKSVVLFVQKYEDIIFNAPCIHRELGVDFEISYIQHIFGTMEFGLFEFADVLKLNKLDKKMIAASAIAVINTQSELAWPLQQLDKLGIEDIVPILNNLKLDNTGTLYKAATIQKMDALIMKKKLEKELVVGAGRANGAGDKFKI